MKNRRRNLAFISLLPFLPLLMGFERAPYSATTKEYSDIQVTAKEKEEGVFEFIIKNVGEGYIYRHVSLHTDTLLIPNNSEINSLFNTHVLVKPNDEYVITSNEDYGEYDFTDATFYTTALIEPDISLSFTGSKTVSQSKDSRWYFYIDCDINGLKPDYRYDYVVTLDYDGVEYCVDTLTDANRHLYYYFSEPEIFDVEKVQVKDIIGFAYEAEKKQDGPNYAGFALGGALYILCILGAVVLGVILFIIVPVIIFGLVRKKRNNTKQ